MTKREFHKTVIQVEVLSEEPVGETSLEPVHQQITEGDWSGTVSTVSTETLDGKQAAEALLNQGSDPSFFRITKNGQDTE
jgi:hypothetical protein